MSSRRKRGEKRDAFSEPAEVAAIYGDGDVDELAAGGAIVQVAPPIAINLLRADPTQPRRTVPLSIRSNWDGGAKAVPALLRRWKQEAENECGRMIEVHKLVRGIEDDQEVEGFTDVDPKTEPMTHKYMQLVSLASGIRRDGLLNPIQVTRDLTGGTIVAGERRWLAHHLLYLYDDDVARWTSIPAFSTERDVWKQAQENGNRSPLNAIEMARQLALLLMDLYKDEVEFEPYDAIVKPFSSDRVFYAQVAGYRIPRGKGDQIKEATGLNSTAQISQYKDLLNLDDHHWQLADEKDWSERRCRRILHPETETPENDDTLTVVNVSPNLFPDMDTAGNGVNLGVGKGYSVAWTPSTDNAGIVPTVDDDELAREQALVEQEILGIDAVDAIGYANPSSSNGEANNAGIDADVPTPSLSPEEKGIIGDGRRREPLYKFPEPKRMPGTSESEQVAFIAREKHRELHKLLDQLTAMCYVMQMPRQKDLLRRVNLWSVEGVAYKVGKAGQELMVQELVEVEEAINQINSAFHERWNELLLDITAVINREVDAGD